MNILYNKGYSRNSIVGKTGIEYQYDSLLQGVPGRESKTVDVRGRVLSDKPIIEPPQMGKNLVLTIDTEVQKLAEKAVGNRVGSIVVLKPHLGHSCGYFGGYEHSTIPLNTISSPHSSQYSLCIKTLTSVLFNIIYSSITLQKSLTKFPPSQCD